MPISLPRRAFFVGAAALAAPWPARAASDQLQIGSARGTIDFAIGDSRVFRTTGGFRSWQGKLRVDDADVPQSSVEVVVDTTSIQMLDNQQTAMLKDADFFDVANFPKMSFKSNKIDRTDDTAFKVTGDLTLRGVTRPMTLDVSVTERNPDAPPGKRYALFKGVGTLRRSEYGMVKYIDLVGDAVEISIRTEAWR